MHSTFTLGGHGYGMKKTGKPVSSWAEAEEWMSEMGWLK